MKAISCEEIDFVRWTGDNVNEVVDLVSENYEVSFKKGVLSIDYKNIPLSSYIVFYSAGNLLRVFSADVFNSSFKIVENG